MALHVLTPEEYARMSWHARQKMVNRQLRERRPAPISPVDWAEQVRAEAKALLAQMPKDPMAAAHRRAL